MATGVSASAANRCRNESNEGSPPQPLPLRPLRTSKQPHRGGYDWEFVNPPPVEFPQTDCPVCLLVLREPHQAACCGNSYCKTCVQRVIDDKKCCPTCNEADLTVFPDKRLKRSLYALNVYCGLRREGCEWDGELGELDRHLNLQPLPEKLLVGCQFAEVDCTYCIEPFQRRYVQAHQSHDCIKRPYTCQHCKLYEATFEEVTQSHSQLCPFFPLSCPNNCELVLQRQELDYHVSQDCPLTVVQCEFRMVGCQVQLPRRDMPSHISENLTGHMSLLQVHMMTHPGENMATYLWLMVGSIQKLAIENASIHSELHSTQQELRESQQTVAELENELNKKLTSCEQKIQAQDVALNQHQKTLEKVTCTGTLPFEFMMTEFDQCKNSSEDWYSPPFYTHTHGYRMCIHVNVNGYGTGEGTHLSVFGYLMRGDFDDDLHWPFQGAITIQLLNQLEDRNHQMHTIAFTGTASPSIAGRVTSGDRAASGRSVQTFISHTQLGLNTDKNCQYLKENQLKFRVSKATNLDPTACIHRRCLVLECFTEAVEPQVCVAPIEFTMSDFEQQKKQDIRWYSPAFYTHPRGYRMCLTVYPNGYGDGHGTHVTIFTGLMQGPFDANLKWPFRGDVSIQVMNQAGPNNCLEKTVTYHDRIDEGRAGRVTDGEVSGGLGFYEFLPHDLLGYNAARNTEYLRFNSLRVRISKIKLKN